MQFDFRYLGEAASGTCRYNYPARKQELEPSLVADGNLQRCSVCGYPFPCDVHPSMSVAFADHLLKAHQLG